MKLFGPFFLEDNKVHILTEALHARRIAYTEKPIYTMAQPHDPRQRTETYSPTYERPGRDGGKEQVASEPTGRLMLEVADEDAEEVERMLSVLR